MTRKMLITALKAPSIALDLPLKILVSEDAKGKVWLSYNSSEYLKERQGLPSNLLPNIAVIENISGRGQRVVQADVRFWGESGHPAAAAQCPLLTQSRHSARDFAVLHSAPLDAGGVVGCLLSC